MEKKLNALLSDLVVEYHKLQSFHWYLKGSHFFDDHAKLESFYDEIAEAVDAVAEAMLQQKLRPESTLKGFLAKTGIHEAENEEVTSEEAYTRVLADFEYLLKEVIVVKEAAEEEKNYFISALMDDYIASFSKNRWESVCPTSRMSAVRSCHRPPKKKAAFPVAFCILKTKIVFFCIDGI